MIAILIILLCLVAGVAGFAYFAYNQVFGKRCDGDERLKYFSHEDFDGLKAAPVEFENDKGDTLRGAIYAKSGLQMPEALIIFSHGMGGGHRSYMTEINTFAQNGFAVLAYDNTGTFASDGNKLGSFCQGPSDLVSAIKFARSHKALGNMKMLLAGHSWGGYSVCQALGNEDVKVEGAVTFGAPDSGYQVIGAAMGEKLAFLMPVFKLAFRILEGERAMVLSSQALANAEPTPVLLLHGKEDHLVPPAVSAAENAKDLPHVKSVIFDSRYHNVYQTIDSEIYMNETFAKINATKKNKNASEEEINACYDIDYELITREDPSIMNAVIKFMKKCIER